MRTPWRLALVIGLTLWPLAVAHGQSGRAALERFRVEWERRTETWRRPGVDGYVYNDSTSRIGNVLLHVEVLDVAEAVVGERSTWVLGDVTPNGRAYFTLPSPPPDHTYRIRVKSFNVITHGGQ